MADGFPITYYLPNLPEWTAPLQQSIATAGYNQLNQPNLGREQYLSPETMRAFQMLQELQQSGRQGEAEALARALGVAPSGAAGEGYRDIRGLPSAMQYGAPAEFSSAASRLEGARPEGILRPESENLLRTRLTGGLLGISPRLQERLASLDALRKRELGDISEQINEAASVRGNFFDTARLRRLQDAGERLGEKYRDLAANELFQDYARERGSQDAAVGAANELGGAEFGRNVNLAEAYGGLGSRRAQTGLSALESQRRGIGEAAELGLRDPQEQLAIAGRQLELAGVPQERGLDLVRAGEEAGRTQTGIAGDLTGSAVNALTSLRQSVQPLEGTVPDLSGLFDPPQLPYPQPQLPVQGIGLGGGGGISGGGGVTGITDPSSYESIDLGGGISGPGGGAGEYGLTGGLPDPNQPINEPLSGEWLQSQLGRVNSATGGFAGPGTLSTAWTPGSTPVVIGGQTYYRPPEGGSALGTGTAGGVTGTNLAGALGTEPTMIGDVNPAYTELPDPSSYQSVYPDEYPLDPTAQQYLSGAGAATGTNLANTVFPMMDTPTVTSMGESPAGGGMGVTSGRATTPMAGGAMPFSQSLYGTKMDNWNRLYQAATENSPFTVGVAMPGMETASKEWIENVLTGYRNQGMTPEQEKIVREQIAYMQDPATMASEGGPSYLPQEWGQALPRGGERMPITQTQPTPTAPTMPTTTDWYGSKEPGTIAPPTMPELPAPPVSPEGGQMQIGTGMGFEGPPNVPTGMESTTGGTGGLLDWTQDANGNWSQSGGAANVSGGMGGIPNISQYDWAQNIQPPKTYGGATLGPGGGASLSRPQPSSAMPRMPGYPAPRSSGATLARAMPSQMQPTGGLSGSGWGQWTGMGWTNPRRRRQRSQYSSPPPSQFEYQSPTGVI